MTSPTHRTACAGALLVLFGAAGAAAFVPAAGFDDGGSGPTYAAESNGTATPVPSLPAFRVQSGDIVMDGVLDEEAWSLARTADGFREHDPNRGGAASVPTTFKVVYDDDAIYFGVACFEKDMADVASYLGRRDDIQASDIVSIYIDPYLDRTTGYNFRINPDGVQYDAYLFDNGARDDDWDAVWQAEVSSDADGWYVEARIPFAAVRFAPSDDMTWGMQVYRWLHGRGEDTGWVLWDRNASGFVSRWGNLTDLRGVRNPRQLEVLPYFVSKATDPAAEGADDQWQDFQNFGADLKYGVTGNLTLNATFQPDFGQVEADPATLNLSPFETYFEEKRPFFTEGARFFQHPDFTLFYSRRIGTGHPNSRIRGAAKLTGKIGSDLSLAVLGAATDVGPQGKVHNPFAGGDQKAYYGLVRVGKEFAEGNHRVNVMGTTVRRDKGSFAGIDNPRLLRDGYSGGFDFEMNFHDRMYRMRGSAVGTIVAPFGPFEDPMRPGHDKRYGTGGRFEAQKSGGKWRGYASGGWESDQLDPNDMGFLSAPDEKYLSAGTSYNYDSDGEDKPFNRLEFEASASASWLYAGGSGRDLASGREVWSYGRGHEQSSRSAVSVWGQHRSFHQGWVYLIRHYDGASKHATRHYDGERGPLMTQPGWWNLACGGTTDWRKPTSLHFEFHGDWGDDLRGLAGNLSLRWNQSQHLSHWIGIGYRHNISEAHWMTNVANDGSQAGVTGIGGVDYVFGRLDQKIWDLTLRSSILFDRDRSLQVYLQPYLTYGDYTDPRWLATPDSYDLRPYDMDAAAHDFRYGALNLNVVYRWEYRPGSTFYLVWTHSKERYDERSLAADPDSWRNDFAPSFVVDDEPRNTFLAKFSYWFSI